MEASGQCNETYVRMPRDGYIQWRESLFAIRESKTYFPRWRNRREISSLQNVPRTMHTYDENPAHSRDLSSHANFIKAEISKTGTPRSSTDHRLELLLILIISSWSKSSRRKSRRANASAQRASIAGSCSFHRRYHLSSASLSLFDDRRAHVAACVPPANRRTVSRVSKNRAEKRKQKSAGLRPCSRMRAAHRVARSRECAVDNFNVII